MQDAEFLTGLGEGTISGDSSLKSLFTRNFNAHQHRIVPIILDSQDDWDIDDANYSDFDSATRPLAANQRDYNFPASLKVLKLKRVDVSYDGTNWYRATPLDSNEITVGIGNDATLDGYFSKTAPRYDSKATGFWLYPRASASDVSSGGTIRIEYSREFDEFTTTDTTQEPGFDEPFHRMISIGGSLDWAIAKGATNAANLKALLDDYEIRLRKYYGRKGEDRDWALKATVIDYN